jgi:hypothetical protein
MNTKRIEANALAVKQTREELEKLIAIKPILAPEEAAKPKGKDAPALPNEGADKERERALKAAEQREQEVRDILHRVREEDDKRELEQIARQNEEKAKLRDEAHQAMLEAIDWEQEQAIKQGEELLAIDAAIAEQKRAQREREKSANQDFWNNLSGLMNTGSKKMFEIGKNASLGQAAIKGAAAVMSAWEAGMSVGGPWAPVVAAAYAAAAGLNAINLMNNIRSQQFGGGGGAPVAPTQGASNVSPVGAGGAGGQQGQGQSMTHIIKGMDPNQLFSGRQLRELLNEGTRDGDRWVFE